VQHLGIFFPQQSGAVNRVLRINISICMMKLVGMRGDLCAAYSMRDGD
jgi:hypothetical protein